MMIIRRILHSHHYQRPLRFKNLSETASAGSLLISLNSIHPAYLTSIFFRPFSFSTQFEPEEYTDPINAQNVAEEKKKLKKPLNVYFREAVGLLEKTPAEDIESGSSEREDENADLKKKLKNLEEELRSLMELKKEEVAKSDEGQLKNESETGRLSLSSLFVNRVGRDGEMLKEKKELKMENSDVYKQLSPDMEKLVILLYKNGYFNNSNFLPRNRFDITCFENSYARDFVKFAAEQFGKDHQEVAKWLSGSELKKVARFGCPSLAKKTVFSAKRLRRFFKIQENTVCDKCILKQSCKFVNQNVWKDNDNNLDLAVVMRILSLYALESIPPQLVVPDEIKDSVSRLLNEAINLSETVT